jgi:diguanylate cyclase
MSTNARWRSRKSCSARSRRCATRSRRGNYEIWYAYATGYHPWLNQPINETLKNSGGLSEDDLENIYATYLSPTRLTERIDALGSQVKGEIEQVVSMIDCAAGSVNSYTESLAGMSEKSAN